MSLQESGVKRCEEHSNLLLLYCIHDAVAAVGGGGGGC